MKLERSDTWSGTGKPVWRITSWYFPWGPWEYSRLAAISYWVWKCWKPELPEFMAMPFVRLSRWFNHKCLVCGRNVRCGCMLECDCHARYCSLECSGYDGALADPTKSHVLFGRVMEPKPHHEWRD